MGLTMQDSLTKESLRLRSDSQTFFIADIAANHDGDMNRAKDLIFMAAEAGADAAKFQHFEAKNIVSDFGFKSLGTQASHQSTWKKSVYQTYKDAEVPRHWTYELKATCDTAGIHFMSTPYDFSAVDLLDEIGVCAHKIGSGDITWLDMIARVARSKKFVFLATGASDLSEVESAALTLTQHGADFCLMQCNTNYTASQENFQHIHLSIPRKSLGDKFS